MNTPSAPQEVPQWAKNAFAELKQGFYIDRTVTTATEEEAAIRIITKHAAAISEENRQLRDRAERAEAWKDVCLNGWDVYQMLTDDMKKKTSAENVADTLDAVARCARRLIELRDAALSKPAQGEGEKK